MPVPKFFKTPKAVAEQMLSDYKSLTGISLKVTDLGREEVIKILTYATAISAFRADLQRTWDDKFPRSATEEALEEHLIARGLPERIQPQMSSGTIRITGSDDTTVDVGYQVRRKSNGAVYEAIESGVVGSDTTGQVDVPFRSLATGVDQNIDFTGEEFEALVSVAGLDSAATNSTEFLSGRDLETPEEMLERIETHDQAEETGGNIAQYESWARAASPKVVRAKGIKRNRGPGTVDVVIISGTTNIEGALRAGESVIRLPAEDVLAAVQVYIEALNPTTDDFEAVAPTEESQDVEVKYDLVDESLRPLVDLEIILQAKLFIYSALSGETIHPTDLERIIDAKVGHLIKERRVSNFDGSTPYLTVGNTKLLIPGTITTGTITP